MGEGLICVGGEWVMGSEWVFGGWGKDEDVMYYRMDVCLESIIVVVFVLINSELKA